MTIPIKANRAYPSLPAPGSSLEAHTRLLEALKEAVEIHERRIPNAYLDSFVRLRELIELGIMQARGNQIVLSLDAVLPSNVALYDGDVSQFSNGTFADGRIAESNVTQHQAALVIDWSQLTSVPSIFPPGSHTHSASDITTGTLSDARLSSNVALYDGDVGQFTSGTFDDARIAESNVTQHQAALSIGWSQLTDVPPIVLESRKIDTGTGLTGGGDLSQDRTIALDATTQSALALATSAVQPGDLAAVATSGDFGDLSDVPAMVSSLGALSDPDADRIVFWDDSADALAFLEIGTGLEISGTSLQLTSAAQNALTLAATALQPGDNISALTNDTGYITGIGGFSIGDLADVNIGTPGSGEDGYALVWDNDEGEFVLAPVSGGGGTVTSVAVSVPTGFTVTGSPITSSGTIEIEYDTGYQGFTSAEAALIASAVQPGDLAAVAFSGDYGDLSNTPTIPPDVSAATFITASDETSTLSNSLQLVAGANITLDTSTPGQIVINSSASGGGGQVDEVIGTAGQIDVDNSDPAKPVLSLHSNVLAALGLAGTAVQPGDLADVAFSGDYGDIINVPSTFPPAAHTHNASDINAGTLADARLSSNVMLTGAYGLGSQSLESAVDMDFVNTTQFNGRFSSETGPGGAGWAYLTLARTPTRVAQIAVRADTQDRTNGNLIAVRHSEDASTGLWYPWRFLWHTGNFDPDTKANASHTHSAEDITSGTLADARLSNNVALLNRTPQTFTGINIFQSAPNVYGAIEVGPSSNRVLQLGSYESGSTDIVSVVNQTSAFGGLIRGMHQGHLVLALRENNATDSVSIISGGGNYASDETYDTLVAQFLANGNAWIGGTLAWGGGNPIASSDDLWHTGNFDPNTKANASHTHSAEDITSGTLSDARLPATIGGNKTFSNNVTVGGTLTVGTNAQIFVETSLVAGSDTVIRNTQGTTWYEIRGLDGNSGNGGLLVRASNNSGEDWTDVLRATPAEIQLDATLLDFNGPVDISGTLAVGGAATFSNNVTVGGTISGNGSGLTSLNASNLSSGTVPSDRLPSTIGGNKTFSNNVTVGGTMTVSGNADISGTLTVGGASTFSGTVTLSGATGNRIFDIVNTSASQIWAMRALTDQLQIGARTSTGSWSNPSAFVLRRSGDTITQVEVPVAVLAGTVATSTSTTLAAGQVHAVTNNATLPNMTAGQWVGVINNSNSPITVTKHASDTMYWTASGSSVTSVTVAARGKAVFFAASNTNVYASGNITGAS